LAPTAQKTSNTRKKGRWAKKRKKRRLVLQVRVLERERERERNCDREARVATSHQHDLFERKS